MPARRRVTAVLEDVAPMRVETGDAASDRDAGETCGVVLRFSPRRSRIGVSRIETVFELGPADSVAAALGLAQILRVLRAARIAAPRDPNDLLEDSDGAQALLVRAIGTELVLELRARSRVSFTAWTETGVQTLRNVVDVREDDTAYLVQRSGGQVPVRVPRDDVVRSQTDCETWWEVTGIERSARESA